MFYKAIFNAKETAQTVANESKKLYDEEKIDGEDLHKILLAIGNLFEYLNDKYVDDRKLNEEVIKMTETLYNPEVERKGIEKGIKEGIKEGKIEDAKNFLKLGVSEEIVAQGTGLTLEKIREIKKTLVN